MLDAPLQARKSKHRLPYLHIRHLLFQQTEAANPRRFAASDRSQRFFASFFCKFSLAFLQAQMIARLRARPGSLPIAPRLPSAPYLMQLFPARKPKIHPRSVSMKNSVFSAVRVRPFSEQAQTVIPTRRFCGRSGEQAACVAFSTRWRLSRVYSSSIARRCAIVSRQASSDWEPITGSPTSSPLALTK